MHPPHAARLIQVSETSLGQLATQLLESLAAVPTHAPPVRVDLLLFDLLALPMPPTPFRFWNVAPDALPVQLHQCRTTVVTLVRHPLFYTPLIDALGHLPGLGQRLLYRRRVTFIGGLPRHCQQRPAGETHPTLRPVR